MDAPIGIFASSFGGLTVARAVLDQLPHESAIYLFRNPSRPAPYPAPHNVVSELAKVGAALKADGVRDVGFTWAADDPRLADAQDVPP